MVIIEEASHPWTYHVFLSFRGEDTRNNFTGHLCSALRREGIDTFMDDQLRRGEEISPALLQAIEGSKISIIVFSKDYGSSKWCLDELVKILECRKSIQQMVRPVFYKVDPSDIRNHRGSFGQALCKFKDNMEKVEKWKKALSEAANLSGWTLSEHCSESSVIHEIVEEISEQVISSTYLDVAKYPVGIKPRVQQIRNLLGVGGRGVRMVGIWGPGGIGKTTIAKAVYNSITHKFDGSCFLENVRENSMGAKGFVKLQKKLLCEILKGTKLKVTNVARGITMIKERLQYKSVLIVLDDVNGMDQIDNLAGQCSWFGMGSRIIITTRDKQLLRHHNVNNLIYEVQKLDHHEALELLSMNAFKRSRPLDAYAELTERAIRYAQGLPLALTVLGSSLCNETAELWGAALDGFKSSEIQDVLKISYNGLDHIVKEAFLDIACFFKGEGRAHVIEILEACGCKHAKIVINVLVEKALIRITYHDSIWMHDLVEEMGRDIVHELSPNDPRNRSRLWFHEDVYRVLTENIGTTNVIGIKVQLPEDSDVICLCGTTFSNMRNLRLLIHRAGHYSGVVDSLPNSLRVVDWPDCALQFLPSNSIPKQLAIINMPRSRITVLGDGYKDLINLTSINLSHCQYLTKVSDLSKIPHLKSLNLAGCENLVEVHSSVGFLDKLDYLNLFYCPGLETFPTEVSWKSMRKLLLPYCERLENFINIVHKMESIKELDLRGSGITELHSWIGCCTSLGVLKLSETPIKQLPSTIENLTSLTYLELSVTPLKELPSSIGCLTSLIELNANGSLIEVLPSSIGNLTSLGGLDLSETPLKGLPSSIGDLTSLKQLNLSKTPIRELPSSIGDLTSLKRLNLSKTPIGELPSSIGDLTSLEELDLSKTPIRELHLSIGNLIRLQELILEGCGDLTNVPHSVYGGLQQLRMLNLSWCPKLVTFPSRASALVSSSAESLPLMLPSNSNNGHDHPGSLLFPQLWYLDFDGCQLSVVSDFLTNLDCVSTLEILNLSRSSFDSLPACISKFRKLQSLNLRGCEWLREISELPPNIEYIYLDDCVSLERFSKLSNILEQKDTRGFVQYMYLSNCNRLMDNLGMDMVSKMAKALPYQLVHAGLDQHVKCWTLMLPSLPEIEVPKWFDRGEVDTSVLPGHGTLGICEILIEIPRNLKAERIGLVVCVVFELIQDFSCGYDGCCSVRVLIDKKYYDISANYIESKATESSAHDHVYVYLTCIAFKELARGGGSCGSSDFSGESFRCQSVAPKKFQGPPG
ncbi:disease resistance protein RPV1-like isoform X1 [Rosa rugosa]|uniref:disease resistance protein RPV1-like isoform X1 n=1 Tax=Rosa rugosa TaxID=74645 RepID=UPI002B407F0E|nr:disease resistance protein RPV1-like isoform X1 [Rosa rugosa]